MQYKLLVGSIATSATSFQCGVDTRQGSLSASFFVTGCSVNLSGHE